MLIIELDTNPRKSLGHGEPVKLVIEFLRKDAPRTTRDVLQGSELIHVPNGFSERQKHFHKTGKRIARTAHQMQRD